jgi:pyrimidine deaminase RibD-like protein
MENPLDIELLRDVGIDYRMTYTEGNFHHVAALYKNNQILESTISTNDENGHAEAHALRRALNHGHLKPSGERECVKPE